MDDPSPNNKYSYNIDDFNTYKTKGEWDQIENFKTNILCFATFFQPEEVINFHPWAG
jgi:hypothetical protein